VDAIAAAGPADQPEDLSVDGPTDLPADQPEG